MLALVLAAAVLAIALPNIQHGHWLAIGAYAAVAGLPVLLIFIGQTRRPLLRATGWCLLILLVLTAVAF